MEGHVRVDRAVDVATGKNIPHRTVEPPQLGQPGGRNAGERPAGRRRFQQNAGLDQAGETRVGHQRHPGAAILQLVQSAFRRQTAHRLAYRHRAGAQQSGEPAYGHRKTRRKTADNDALTQPAVDVFTHGLAHPAAKIGQPQRR